MEMMQFVPGWTSFYIGNGIELADLEGVQVPFLHINHLIANKKTVNRPKDQIDILELEKIRKIREEKK